MRSPGNAHHLRKTLGTPGTRGFDRRFGYGSTTGSAGSGAGRGTDGLSEAPDKAPDRISARAEPSPAVAAAFRTAPMSWPLKHLRVTWHRVITRISPSSPCCCRDRCGRISATSTPSAAWPTTWATNVCSAARALEHLDRFRERPARLLRRARAGTLPRAPRHDPAHDIPIEPFLDLIDAFEQDQRVNALRHLRATCSTTAAAARTPSAGWSCTCAATATSSGSDYRTTPAPRCNWPTSGRTSAATCATSAAFISPARLDAALRRERAGPAARPASEPLRQLIRFEVDRTESMFAKATHSCRCWTRRCGDRWRCLARAGGPCYMPSAIKVTIRSGAAPSSR